MGYWWKQFFLGNLCFGDDVSLARARAEEGRERGGHHHRVRPDKPAQIAAGKCVLLRLQHQRVHGEEAVPRQPDGALQAQKRSAVEAQRESAATVGHQVKPAGGKDDTLSHKGHRDEFSLSMFTRNTTFSLSQSPNISFQSKHTTNHPCSKM